MVLLAFIIKVLPMIILVFMDDLIIHSSENQRIITLTSIDEIG